MSDFSNRIRSTIESFESFVLLLGLKGFYSFQSGDLVFDLFEFIRIYFRQDSHPPFLHKLLNFRRLDSK